MRSLLAIVLAILAAAVVYDGLAFEFFLGPGHAAIGWAQALTLLAPALLVALLFATFVLMPLWMLIAKGGTKRKRLLFAAAGALIWVAICAVLFGTGVVQRGNEIAEASSLLVPGLVLVATFALVARPPALDQARSAKETRKTGAAAEAAAADSRAPERTTV